MGPEVVLAELRSFRIEINGRLTTQDEALNRLEARTRDLELGEAKEAGIAHATGKFREGARWLVTLIVGGIGAAFGMHFAQH